MYSFIDMESNDKMHDLNWRVLTSWPLSLIGNGNSVVVVLYVLGFCWATDGTG